jgi:hypothetical protein
VAEGLHGGPGVVTGGAVQEVGNPGRAALGVQMQEAGQLRLGGFDQLRPGSTTRRWHWRRRSWPRRRRRAALGRGTAQGKLDVAVTDLERLLGRPATDPRTADKRALT